ncbi:MAG: D-alanine--D-alanine ligase [Vicingaceae bacterium]|nr:D-alanine--D-alanine ligase [Vicingaceae bacterium]
MKSTIAIIEGGYSHEKVISLKSATTVFENIDLAKYTPIKVRIDEEGWVAFINENKIPINRDDFSVTINNEKIKFDFAFIVIHVTHGEDGKLKAYFDMIGLPYSTCNHLAATLTFNKYVCNQFLKSLGITVANAILVRKNEIVEPENILKTVGLPCFVKPADGGSSFGVSKVKEGDELLAAIQKAQEHGTEVLVEAFMEGREFTNGVYLSKNGIKVLPITEIITQNEFFDFEAKYLGESQEITPAAINAEMTNRIKQITQEVYQILGLKGMCRVDYILVGKEPHVIEVNTVPGLSAQSLIPQMAAYEGISLKELFSEVITVATKK